jgi:transcriptional regulator with XRE-family HTH domain
MLDREASLRGLFGRTCRATRINLRMSQQQLADRVGLSRGYVATIERGRANPTLVVVERVSRALGLEAQLMLRAPSLLEPRQRDLVHARCSGYVDRRLRSLGWRTAREVEIVDGRSHGWIDCLAFDPHNRTLVVIEIKTRLDDLGLIERQLGWYERTAAETAGRLGWRPTRIVTWLLLLASQEVDLAVHTNRELLAQGFPARAREILAWLREGHNTPSRRGLALLDPSSKRRDWLIRTRVDGRRSPAPYRDYAAAARHLGPDLPP